MEISDVFVNYWEIINREELSQQNHECEIIYSKHIPQYETFGLMFLSMNE